MSKPGQRLATQTPTTIDVFCRLHALHFSRSVIAQMTGCSSAFVRQMLCDAGRRERWDHVDDARADLPASLREACDRLMSARAAQPIDSRTALAIARRLEFRAAIERLETSG